MNREEFNSFLEELGRLCEKYRVVLETCGCCESPVLAERIVVDGKPEIGKDLACEIRVNLDGASGIFRGSEGVEI